MGIFSPAIEELSISGQTYREPEDFSIYLKRHNLACNKTAEALSVDSLAKLDSELKSAGLMVLRLGSGDGIRTRFALVKNRNGWNDFFLQDDLIISSTKPIFFIPNANFQTLFGFKLIPKLTETSLVSFAVHSGLLSHALGFDPNGVSIAPATGQSRFSFKFRPLREENGLIFEHVRGQVEIDAFFLASKGNKHIAVIVEAKFGEKMGSLAKHKLLYPYLALRDNIPSYMHTMLVYMRVIRRQDGHHFYICECEFKEDDELININSLSPKSASHFVVHI
jgi:hypothetical protein